MLSMSSVPDVDVKAVPEIVIVPFTVILALPPVNVPPEKTALSAPIVIVFAPWVIVPE
ncbi:hypothetical protein ES705_32740 [subsurface metagenome]